MLYGAVTPKHLDIVLSLKIDFVVQVKDIINFKKRSKSQHGLKVTVIFVNMWILPVGGVALH